MDVNEIILNFKVDSTKNPVLSIFDYKMPILTDEFSYTISPDDVTAGSIVAFYVSTNEYTGSTFTIEIPSNVSENWIVRQTADFSFYLAGSSGNSGKMSIDIDSDGMLFLKNSQGASFHVDSQGVVMII